MNVILNCIIFVFIESIESKNFLLIDDNEEFNNNKILI